MPTQKSAVLRHRVMSNLNFVFPGIVPRGRLLLVNNSTVNLRVSDKQGSKFWFDVSWGLLKGEEVDFFIYACGSEKSMYVFPKRDFEKMIEHASLGGIKLDPNFTIFLDTHQLEPAGSSDLKSDIRQYYNNFDLILLAKKARLLPPSPVDTPKAADIAEPPARHQSTVYRILRDTALSRDVKKTRNFKCQVCRNEGLPLGEGKLYAEVHHIRPLGTPHDGLDVIENVLCVCPNCHVLLDYGAVALDTAKLESVSGHEVSAENIAYHNTSIFGKTNDRPQ